MAYRTRAEPPVSHQLHSVDNGLTSLSLSFFLCYSRMTAVPTLQGCGRDSVRWTVSSS